MKNELIVLISVVKRAFRYNRIETKLAIIR